MTKGNAIRILITVLILAIAAVILMFASMEADTYLPLVQRQSGIGVFTSLAVDDSSQGLLSVDGQVQNRSGRIMRFVSMKFEFYRMVGNQNIKVYEATVHLADLIAPGEQATFSVSVGVPDSVRDLGWDYVLTDLAWGLDNFVQPTPQPGGTPAAAGGGL